MAPWLEHPQYVPTRERLIGYLTSDRYRFRRSDPVIFLCGGADSPHRTTLRDYLRKHFPGLSLFYAERVWGHIASRANRSALKMEADLAALADLLIIIVESPGTFAELGAFSLSEPLRAKLLPIVDTRYRDSQSFISTGPLRWIDTESHFAPTIYAPLERILEAIDEVEERLGRIPRARSTRVSDLALSPKHLLFFVCDLIAVTYPVTLTSVQYYLGRIAPSTLACDIDLPTLIGLAIEMGLLIETPIETGTTTTTFYSPSSSRALERPFHHRRLLDLPSQRADHASTLLTLPAARNLLQALKRAS